MEVVGKRRTVKMEFSFLLKVTISFSRAKVGFGGSFERRLPRTVATR